MQRSRSGHGGARKDAGPPCSHRGEVRLSRLRYASIRASRAICVAIAMMHRYPSNMPPTLRAWHSPLPCPARRFPPGRLARTSAPASAAHQIQFCHVPQQRSSRFAAELGENNSSNDASSISSHLSALNCLASQKLGPSCSQRWPLPTRLTPRRGQVFFKLKHSARVRCRRMRPNHFQ